MERYGRSATFRGSLRFDAADGVAAALGAGALFDRLAHEGLVLEYVAALQAFEMGLFYHDVRSLLKFRWVFPVPL